MPPGKKYDKKQRSFSTPEGLAWADVLHERFAEKKIARAVSDLDSELALRVALENYRERKTITKLRSR